MEKKLLMLFLFILIKLVLFKVYNCLLDVHLF